MKWKWIMAQIKKEKDEGMKITYGLEREFTPLEMSLTEDKTQSHHLGYYPPKIRPR